MCWHFSLRTYSIDATTALWICFLLLHKPAKFCVSICFLTWNATTELRICFVLYNKSAKSCVFPLFSHTKDDHGLAELFSLMAQVRQMLRFPSVFSHERRPRTCGLVFSYGTSPAHVAFSLCFHTRKTPADLRTCFLLKELICFWIVSKETSPRKSGWHFA